jgi:hypothetical protein
LFGGLTLAQRLLGLEMDSMGSVNQAIQDGIGQGRIPDVVMPVTDWELAGDDAGWLSTFQPFGTAALTNARVDRELFANSDIAAKSRP